MALFLPLVLLNFAPYAQCSLFQSYIQSYLHMESDWLDKVYVV